MEEIDVFKSMRESVEDEFSPFVDEKEAARLKLISDHKAWLKKIKKEHPSPYQFFKVGVYIRYFNQTKYENYLDYHKMQFIDLINKYPIVLSARSARCAILPHRGLGMPPR